MSVCTWGDIRVGVSFVLMLFATAALLTGCEQRVPAAEPEVRPVRTLTVEMRAAGEPVILTGQIEAEDEVNLAFRISGRVLTSGGLDTGETIVTAGVQALHPAKRPAGGVGNARG